MDFDTLRAVLARETLNCREAVVFHAALRWSGAECHRRGLEPTADNRREALGPALHQIRFPAMSVQEFADEVVKFDMLTLQVRGRSVSSSVRHFSTRNSSLSLSLSLFSGNYGHLHALHCERET